MRRRKGAACATSRRARDELDRLIRVIDSLPEIPDGSAPSRYVAKLRGRLMNEALDVATEDHDS
jgi:hypothetical protein